MFEKVIVHIRFYADAPVKAVILRTIPNGSEVNIDMTREQGLMYYACTLPMLEKRMQYQFYLVCEDVVYYYTQRGITTYIPDHDSDFVLLTDYVQPEWVKETVFYQIFPERFCNGDEAGIGGWFGSIEGCRFPMSWDGDYTGSEIYRLNQTLARLKREGVALRSGGFQFLYAEKGVVAVARFTHAEAYVAVMSTNEEAVAAALPLGAIGAEGIDCDVTGREVAWERLDENHAALRLKPHGAHLLRCRMK